ncbi:MAG: hypothetical protein M1815_002830 [Lichina confinis]|nr:MAG: hypothetical protein M1815_002830 [Lichina confinis]
MILQHLQKSSEATLQQTGSRPSDKDESRLIINLLKNSRKKERTDALYHLGVCLGRWDAVMQIVRLTTADWLADGQRSSRDAVSEILQSVGEMISHAADLDSRESTAAMAHVLPVIAHLHHVGATPTHLYQPMPRTGHETTYQPPTLPLWSDSIWAALSDATLATQSRFAPAKVELTTFEKLFVPRTELVTPRLAPDAWMEFVLWECALGHFPAEGASIVQQLMWRDSGWKAVDWDPALPSVMPATRSITSVRMIGSDTYRPETLSLGPKWISGEVVRALMDELVAHPRLRLCGNDRPPTRILKLIQVLKSFLIRSGIGFDRAWWHQLVARILDAIGPGLGSNDHALRVFYHIATNDQPNDGIASSAADDGQTVTSTPREMSSSTTLVEYMSYQLFRVAQSGDLRRADGLLELLRRVPAVRWLLPQNLQATTPSAAAQKDRAYPPAAGHLARALACYLDLVVQRGCTGLRGGILDAEVLSADSHFVEIILSSTTLQTSLIRFAGASADEALLLRLHTLLAKSLTTGHFRAMLECEIRMRRWEAVLQILTSIRNAPDRTWDANTAMVLASTIMALRDGPAAPTDAERADIGTAHAILANLLAGIYGPPEIERLHTPKKQELYIETLRWMIEPAASGLSFVGGRRERLRLKSTVVEVPVGAFNVLLQAVVRHHGSQRGKELWNLWCTENAKDDVGATGGQLPYITVDSSIVTMPAERLIERSPAPTKKSLRDRIVQLNNAPTVSQAAVFPYTSSRIPVVTPNIATLDIIAEHAVGEWAVLEKKQQQQQQPPPQASEPPQHPKHNSTFSEQPSSEKIKPKKISPEEMEQQKIRRLLCWALDQAKSLGLNADSRKEYIVGSQLHPEVAETTKPEMTKPEMSKAEMSKTEKSKAETSKAKTGKAKTGKAKTSRAKRPVDDMDDF